MLARCHFGQNRPRNATSGWEFTITGLLNEGFRYRDLEAGVFLTRDPAGFVDGPNVYSYVRQNPWTTFDPLGLSERIDDDGFEWSDRNHHIVPREVGRDSGWTPEAKDIFNRAVINTTEVGHNNSAHPKYNKEVAAEMAEFVAKWAPGGVGQVSPRDQVKMANDFVKEIQKTENKYINGFNKKRCQARCSLTPRNPSATLPLSKLPSR